MFFFHIQIDTFYTSFIPECASDKSKILIPLSTANLIIVSACSSDTDGAKMDHVPRPTLLIRKPLLPKFLYRKPGVALVQWRIGSPGFEPRLIERPILEMHLFFNVQVYKYKCQKKTVTLLFNFCAVFFVCYFANTYDKRTQHAYF